MGINTETRKNVDYFEGVEVEHTVMKGRKTFFVVGVKPTEEVIDKAKDIDHIYLGTSQSFNPVTDQDWKNWDNLIYSLLKNNYWVTLDFDVKYADEIHEVGWCEYDHFIPMISVKLPYIKLYNYNTTLKIDDTTWGFSNPGVWTHSLHELMSNKSFTSWMKYKEDTILK